ncbi:MAG TPA: type II toxin-antitoxin system HicB family antitoxin [Anaerolineaceae bacterium]|jgi:predicted HicB family RNase H-like nuclease|nr:type II toxin-antitoxin system HicB family antitoxin [Anaerolineaceae bacterium]HPL48873.1 type II toxin-antitoxin system HicB family antitoxin [Smithella sp.]
MSKNYLKYKKYVGTVQFDADDRIFHGHVLGINDSISFEGSSVEELEQDFKAAIENYLETCRKIGKEPEKPFKGAFNLRLDPSLHEMLVAGALQEGKTLNAFVKDVLKKAVSEMHLS